MANILAVGIATLDIVNSVSHYPREDEEMRASSQRISRGGNATNTLQVLQRLGHEVSWSGVLAEDGDAVLIRESLDASGIRQLACRTYQNGRSPVSYITHNLQNGSRTIVHYRDLPEFSFGDFSRVPLEGIDWLHFEGRNPEETLRMVQLARRQAGLRISLEMEKPRPGLEAVMQFADVVFFSRVYVQHQYGEQAAQFLQAMHQRYPEKILVCAWGEQGAYGVDDTARIYHSPAFPPLQLVDTLGAGDTFNAAMIDALLRGMDLENSLRHACVIAGRKCGITGFEISLGTG